MTPKSADRARTPQGVFGAELRLYRTQAGLSQAELADKAHVSHDVISKIETGERPPAEGFPGRLDAIAELDTRGTLTRIWGELRESARYSAYPGWFRPWADIEASATELRWYEPLVIPGLLQTEEYARALLSAQAGADTGAVEEQVAARLARQAVLDGERPPYLWCLLDEGVIRRPIGGPKVMHTQLLHLADMPDSSRVSVQVIPLEVGAHAGLLANFIIATAKDGPGILYLETATTGQVVEVPLVVSQASLIFDTLRSEALPRKASRDMIMKVAEQQWT